ncbi:hypothetical protein B0I35DRAFT_433420 [Stachybotrys elegans]|uniref:Uncharacterized protein n=1 Tax=Stachybotrys elegans TaxID=80388 RepID=A0A8K0SM40_9HYPO|nr:hypothetical protein B0I35DRAFT_433420 [Stachybotrys elegans]
MGMQYSQIRPAFAGSRQPTSQAPFFSLQSQVVIVFPFCRNATLSALIVSICKRKGRLPIEDDYWNQPRQWRHRSTSDPTSSSRLPCSGSRPPLARSCNDPSKSMPLPHTSTPPVSYSSITAPFTPKNTNSPVG